MLAAVNGSRFHGLDDLVPVAHTAGPYVDQHLVRPEHRAFRQVKRADGTAELGNARC